MFHFGSNWVLPSVWNQRLYYAVYIIFLCQIVPLLEVAKAIMVWFGLTSSKNLCRKISKAVRHCVNFLPSLNRSGEAISRASVVYFFLSFVRTPGLIIPIKHKEDSALSLPEKPISWVYSIFLIETPSRSDVAALSVSSVRLVTWCSVIF